MTQSIIIGSASGASAASAIFFGIAVLIGVALAHVLGRLAAAEDERPYWLTTPVARRSASILVGAGLGTVIWLWLWAGFYRLDVSHSAVTVTWLVPTRQTTIGRAAIDSARWEPGPKGSRYLVITTHDGRRFRSAQTTIARDAETAIVRKIMPRDD